MQAKARTGMIAKRLEFDAVLKWLGRGNSSVVEHDLAKVGVAGSNPVSRSSQIPRYAASA